MFFIKTAASLTLAVMFCAALLAPTVARAQATQPADANAPETGPAPVLPGRPDASLSPGATNRLAKRFESAAAGISFGAPADPNAKEARPNTPGTDELVTYTNEPQRWVIKVARLNFAEGVAMTYHKKTDNGPDVNGLFQETIDNLKRDTPGFEVLREEILHTGPLDIGLIAGRFNAGTEHNVAQIALVRQTPLDNKVDAARLYYTFSLTVAAPKLDPSKPDGGDVGELLAADPNVRAAVETFNQMIDSIELLDQTAIREDQNQRLFRTRTLYVNLTRSRLEQALVPEQWLRLLKDGKDIGYSYVVEQVGRDLPRGGHKAAQLTGGQDGVLIGVRTRTVPETGVRVDGETWMWTSFDRKHEKWSTASVIDNPATGKELVGDSGSSDTNTRLVRDERLQAGEQIAPGKVDPSQPPVRQAEVMSLNVTHFERNRSEAPIVRDLPPFYLTQAIAHLLPRLVARGGPKTYLFAAYNGGERQVMLRYIDVEAEQTVELGGKRVPAIAVKDKWGMQGSVTTHYVSPKDGKYLGSVSPQSGITILPTDAATLERLWKDVNLTPPGAVDERK